MKSSAPFSGSLPEELQGSPGNRSTVPGDDESPDAELERVKRELADSQTTYQVLQTRLQELAQALEQQRESFSRELHDETAQHLTSLAVGIKRLEALLPSDSEARKTLEQVQHNWRELADAVHHLSLRLRPEMIEKLGICPALLKHLEHWSRQHGIEVSFESTGLLRLSIPTEIEIAIYRIVQESLTNVVRHAQATSIRVWLHGNHDFVRVLIEDNGCGFDVDKAMTSTSRLGLTGMQERAALVQGLLHIDSAPQQGTIILLRIPLPHVPNEGPSP